ncbi:hypothetical protein HA402_001263 [Bradysia odoriphaga]|nr:hypothetical protein HA402_001263 [Bradysia odoriphaga]
MKIFMCVVALLMIWHRAAAVDIQCYTTKGRWCTVEAKDFQYADGDKLNIVNHTPQMIQFQWIYKANFRWIPSEIFETFPSLDGINWGTGIEMLRQGALVLRYIDLSENQIDSFEVGTFDLPMLRTLSINSNHIKNLPANLFSSAPHLWNVDLNDNVLETIPDAFFSAHNVSNINFDGNYFYDWTDLDAFAQIKTLKTVSMYNTDFYFKTYVTSPRQGPNITIDDLNISDNGITGDDIFYQLANFPNLTTLNLNENKFNRILGVNKVKEMFPELRTISIEKVPVSCSWIRKSDPKFTRRDITMTSMSDEDELLLQSEFKHYYDEKAYYCVEH